MRLAFISLVFFGTASAADFRAFLDNHCLECHDAGAKKGGLDLSMFTDETAVMADRGVWRSVYEKVESHQMPPPKQKAQPSAGERADLLAWIMDVAARPDPVLGVVDPGKPVMRRLTRLEYNNAIRDLLGLDMDLFMFSERLPISDKGYFQPASGTLGVTVKVPLREYGAKYPVLCRNLGLPGDNRAEHGFRNRGDAMDFSPLLLEKYLAAAHEIVNAPELPQRSRIFADLIGSKHLPLAPPAPEKTVPPLVAAFAPHLEKPARLQESPEYFHAFRHQLAVAHAEGRGGVFDVASAIANQVVSGKGGLIRASFGARTLSINPNTDLWLATFATTKPASDPAILTNKEKGRKTFELTFDILSDDEDEGIKRLGLCVMGRDKQSGSVTLTAVFTDDTDAAITATIAEGAAGTTFISFVAHPGESIKKLIVDGSQFSGDFVLLDDLGIITDGKAQSGLSLASPPTVPDTAKAAATLAPRPRLAAFLARAFRRSVSEEEVDRFFSIFQDARQRGKTEPEAMKETLAAILASPAFLFVEANGNPGDEKVTALEEHELATRLALFLWASTPDDELLALAKSGKLSDPATLEAQTRRLLRDSRSRELSESFAVQWLRLDQLFTSKPDRDLFPAFYAGPQGKATLHGEMLTEALLLFETVQVEDRSILDLINADYTWLNGSLAKLYGLDSTDEEIEPTATNRELKKRDDTRNQWRRVKLGDATRGGYLTMAAPMTLTSLPFRTSPVKRGAWLLETFFNRPPTEPKVAFAFEDDTKDAAQKMSIRERFEAHRNQAACYTCHIRLDPPGFALEAYNPIGAWLPLADAKSDWHGQPFDGPAEFKQLLAASPHEFTRGFIEHLLSYALGRKLELYDMPVVESIEQAARADGWKLSRVVVEIAKSYPFKHVRTSQGD